MKVRVNNIPEKKPLPRHSISNKEGFALWYFPKRYGW